LNQNVLLIKLSNCQRWGCTSLWRHCKKIDN